MSDKNPAPTAEPENADAVEAENDEVMTEEAVVAPPRKKTKTPASPAVETVEPVAVEPAEVKSAEAPPAASADSGSQPRVVYVEAPLPPKKKGNRGMGALFALLSVLLYGALLALTAFIAAFFITGTAAFAPSALFFVPILAFAVGFLLLVLVLNRANWSAFVIGSIFVAAFVYFGTIGGVLLLNNVVLMTGAEASSAFRQLLTSPIIILAALLAREVSLWAGAAISARGRAVKAKNAEARAAFDREAASRKAEYEAAKAANAS